MQLQARGSRFLLLDFVTIVSVRDGSSFLDQMLRQFYDYLFANFVREKQDYANP